MAKNKANSRARRGSKQALKQIVDSEKPRVVEDVPKTRLQKQIGSMSNEQLANSVKSMNDGSYEIASRAARALVPSRGQSNHGLTPEGLKSRSTITKKINNNKPESVSTLVKKTKPYKNAVEQHEMFNSHGHTGKIELPKEKIIANLKYGRRQAELRGYEEVAGMRRGIDLDYNEDIPIDEKGNRFTGEHVPRSGNEIFNTISDYAATGSKVREIRPTAPKMGNASAAAKRERESNYDATYKHAVAMSSSRPISKKENEELLAARASGHISNEQLNKIKYETDKSRKITRKDNGSILDDKSNNYESELAKAYKDFNEDLVKKGGEPLEYVPYHESSTFNLNDNKVSVAELKGLAYDSKAKKKVRKPTAIEHAIERTKDWSLPKAVSEVRRAKNSMKVVSPKAGMRKFVANKTDNKIENNIIRTPGIGFKPDSNKVSPAKANKLNEWRVKETRRIIDSGGTSKKAIAKATSNIRKMQQHERLFNPENAKALNVVPYTKHDRLIAHKVPIQNFGTKGILTDKFVNSIVRTGPTKNIQDAVNSEFNKRGKKIAREQAKQNPNKGIQPSAFQQAKAKKDSSVSKGIEILKARKEDAKASGDVKLKKDIYAEQKAKADTMKTTTANKPKSKKEIYAEQRALAALKKNKS